jgi:cysteine sulfinate desulfinase/cysteine desulfurase-like protein
MSMAGGKRKKRTVSGERPDLCSSISAASNAIWARPSRTPVSMTRNFGDSAERLPNTLNVLFPGVRGGDLLEAVPRICASTGSACHAGDPKPSGVLLALGLAPEQALGAVRLSLGRTTSEGEVSEAAALLAKAWGQMSAKA